MKQINLIKYLQRGLYLDNIYEIEKLCRELTLDTNHPASYFLLGCIFSDIASKWDERPVTVEEAKLVENQILKPIFDLLRGIENEIPNSDIYVLQNLVVSSYVTILKNGV